MDFSYNNNTKTIEIISEKKNISLSEDAVILDGLAIESAGEYEKGGFLMYVHEEGVRYYHFRVEGQWIGYIPVVPTEMSSKILDFFGQLDILVAPFAKSEQKFLEQMEPRMLISYADNGSELIPILGEDTEIVNSYKLKVQDLSSEKTSLVLFG